MALVEGFRPRGQPARRSILENSNTTTRLSLPAKLAAGLALIAGLGALALIFVAPAPNADAALKPAASLCPNPGVFTGTNASGNLQAALDDAIAKAEACAGCCDMLVTWEVQEISGRRGGIAGFDDVNVKIVASW